MANHFTALKRARPTAKRTARNRANRSRLRTALRQLRESLAKGEKQSAEQVFRQTVCRKTCSADCFSPLASDSRSWRSAVRRRERLARLRAVRLAVGRARFSAVKWFAILV